jgi:hypothetical protein
VAYRLILLLLKTALILLYVSYFRLCVFGFAHVVEYILN